MFVCIGGDRGLVIPFGNWSALPILTSLAYEFTYSTRSRKFDRIAVSAVYINTIPGLFFLFALVFRRHCVAACASGYFTDGVFPWVFRYLLILTVSYRLV
jgi:hypothetical protein